MDFNLFELFLSKHLAIDYPTTEDFQRAIQLDISVTVQLGDIPEMYPHLMERGMLTERQHGLPY